ncbi:MAG TPA: hypothetical protein VIG73_12935 [Cerasibacillus sp.]|uniref:hypothetical protein n=1 Tax=Cerasibacillus sp. TaxID=2498711 RepID=UPI002F402411
MRIFSFESKRLIKKKTTRVMLMLSILAVSTIYLLHFNLAEQVQKKVTNHNDFLIDLYKQDQVDWEIKKKEAQRAKDEEVLEEATFMEEHARSTHEHYLMMKEAYQNEDWKKIFQHELKQLKLFAYPPPEEPADANFENQEITNFTLRASYEEVKYMLENDIKPFMQNITTNMYLPTIYDSFSGRTLALWQEETKRYGREGIYYLYQLIQSLYIPIIILIGSFIFGNTFSSDTKKNNHIRFYQVLPLHRTKLFFTKYVTGYLGILLFVLIMLGVPIAVGTIMHGFGDLKYPILVYDGYTTEYMNRNIVEDTFHFIPLQKYLTQTLVLAIVMSLLIYTMYFLVSQFIKEPIFNMIIVGILTFVGTLISHPYNPFSYIDTDKVITHEIQLQTLNTDFTMTMGIIVTLGLSLVFMALNYISFKYNSRNDGGG